MRKSSLWTALYVLLLFLSGSVVGVFGYRLYIMNSVSAGSVPKAKLSPEEWRQKYMSEMRSRLSLSEQQATQVNALLDEARSRYHASRQRAKAEMKTIHEEQVQKIRAILSDQQKVEYDKLREERERRRQQAQKSRPGC